MKIEVEPEGHLDSVVDGRLTIPGKDIPFHEAKSSLLSEDFAFIEISTGIASHHHL